MIKLSFLLILTLLTVQTSDVYSNVPSHPLSQLTVEPKTELTQETKKPSENNSPNNKKKKI